MGLHDLVKIDLTIDENAVIEGAKEILKILRPKWNRDDVKYKMFNEGITNKLVGCQEPSDTEKKDVILVRIFGQKTELIIDRDMEMQNMVVLNGAGCAKPLFAQFTNGLAYGFIPGQCLDMQTVRDPDVGRLVAKEMVRIHAIEPESAVSEADRALIKVDKQPFVFNKMKSFLAAVPDEYPDANQNKRFKNETAGKTALLAEVEEMRSHIEPLNMPSVFSHNDILLKNVVVNDNDKRAYFIDFEYGAFNYESYDIGNHFCEWAGIDTVDYALYPDRDTQMQWLRAYLQEKHAHEGSNQLITQQHLDVVYAQVNKCALLAHLFWGLWGLIQARYSTIDFDYLDYAIIRLNEYFAKKKEFLAL